MAEKPQSNPRTDQDHFQVVARQLTLPKGGGAILGIGEKFAANLVIGPGSRSVPIYSSPGRQPPNISEKSKLFLLNAKRPTLVVVLRTLRRSTEFALEENDNERKDDQNDSNRPWPQPGRSNLRIFDD